MDNKLLEGALRVISSYQVDGIANFNQKGVECYCSKNTWYSYTKQLEELGVIEKLNENGYYPRYKVNEILPCPDYLLDTNLSVYNKATLLKLSTLTNEYREYSRKAIAKELGDVNIKGKLDSIKEATGKEWYEILEESNAIVQSLDTSSLVDTDKGYKYVPKHIQNPSKLESLESERKDAWKLRQAREMQKENIATTLYRQHLHSSKYRNKTKEFELTVEDIQEVLDKQECKCFYTGLKFENKDGRRPSIDRVDSAKGYTKDNIVITLGVVNLMKRDLELNEFIELCSQVANHFNNK